MVNRRFCFIALSILFVLSLAGYAGQVSSAQAAYAATLAGGKNVDWHVYGGQPEGDRYSALKQIDKWNVNQLQVAWTYDAGKSGGLQTHPLVVGRTVFIYTPTQKVVALDATNGTPIWTFDSGIAIRKSSSLLNRN